MSEHQTPAPVQEAEDFNAYEAQEQAAEPAATEEKPAAETAEESEASEEQKETEEQTESEDSEESEEEAEGEKEEKPKKKGGGFQRKIDKLTKRNSDLAAQNRALEERLERLEKKDEPKPEKAEPSSTDDPKPRSEEFEFFDDFTEAMTDWKLRQKEKAEFERKSKEEAEAAKRKAAENWKTRVDAARERYEDYDEVLETAEDLDVPVDLETALLEAGPEIIYHLAKNRDEAKRIADLPLRSALREIGKIEAKLADSSKEPPPKPQPRKTSSAPKPAPSLSGPGGVAKRAHEYTGEYLEEYESLRK